MLDAYAAGQDGQTRLTLLSTWLGHVHPASITDRLIRQRHASPHTIAAYRDTLRLLLTTPPPRPAAPSAWISPTSTHR